MEAVLTNISVRPAVRRLNLFEKYLTIWVGLCMVAGVALGKWAPHLVPLFRNLEFGTASHINIPIAVLIWLRIVPMMMRVDFASVRHFSRGFSSDTCWHHGCRHRRPINTSQGPSSWPRLPAPLWFLCGAISPMATRRTPLFKCLSTTSLCSSSSHPSWDY